MVKKMGLDITGLGSVFQFGAAVIDKIFPDQESKQRAKIELAMMQQNGELKELETRMSAILAEAKSADPWTSRARPSFLYVIYLMILMAIPIGILSAFNPAMAIQIASGMQAWLASIPDALWATFGIGYTGYTVARSAWDKKRA